MLNFVKCLIVLWTAIISKTRQQMKERNQWKVGQFHAPDPDHLLCSLSHIHFPRSDQARERTALSTTYSIHVVIKKIHDSIGFIIAHYFHTHPYYIAHSYYIAHTYHIVLSLYYIVQSLYHIALSSYPIAQSAYCIVYSSHYIAHPYYTGILFQWYDL